MKRSLRVDLRVVSKGPIEMMKRGRGEGGRRRRGGRRGRRKEVRRREQ
jgi:hypothetical protein